MASLIRGPLGMGSRTGKLAPDSTFPHDDVRRHASWHPAFRNGRPSAEWLHKLESIRAVLTSDGRTLAQGALAWIWGRSGSAILIPGFRTVRQVEENCGAICFGSLTPEQMGEIDEILGRAR
jgi:aryl-alcohol dehydrogenase-like predicted oxidoreductase